MGFKRVGPKKKAIKKSVVLRHNLLTIILPYSQLSASIIAPLLE